MSRYIEQRWREQLINNRGVRFNALHLKLVPRRQSKVKPKKRLTYRQRRNREELIDCAMAWTLSIGVVAYILLVIYPQVHL